ncbi:chromate efflux transporter [Marinomonas sp. 2405UD68-3]|uniref:chromate efflux transporter n=1 Tax=Marinomonas sp. 2405UD68-3 TaxID=3391835 RepID=UPI0039C9DBB2
MSVFFEIFTRFFVLGCSSFGGPAAHLGYFHREFVEHRKWVSKDHYAQFVMLSQVIPGPGSSQVGFAIGYHRGGWLGAVSAFLGFTLPSVVLMLVLVWANVSLQTNAFIQYWLHGLTLLAGIVVADACYTMWKQFCKTKVTSVVAILSVVFLFVWPFGLGALALLFITAMVGCFLSTHEQKNAVELADVRFANIAGLIAVALFLLSFLTFSSIALDVFFDYYQAGSLVFGGGHVILPLLQNVLDQQSEEIILAGYALAQSVPGPMFTVATFLGGVTGANVGGIGSLVLIGGLATLGVFLPGLLLMMFAQHHWKQLSTIPKMNAVIVVLNAAVVGLLMYIFISVVLPHSVLGFIDGVIVLCGGVWLFWRRPSILILLLTFSIMAFVRYLIA